jgi:hypothetical protein
LAEITLYNLQQSQEATNNINSSPRFLSWLTRWLVGETASFRESVVDMTTSTSYSTCRIGVMTTTKSQVDALESERLVTAGNGFVLLSCLMIQDSNQNTISSKRVHPSSTTSSILNVILSELPGDGLLTKLSFVRNTLVAFCNFYHFSVGDLSVAIVAPVKDIMARLDALHKSAA